VREYRASGAASVATAGSSSECSCSEVASAPATSGAAALGRRRRPSRRLVTSCHMLALIHNTTGHTHEKRRTCTHNPATSP